LADERGRKIVLLIGIIAAAITPLGYLIFKSIPLLMVLRTFHGISIAAFATGFNTLVADIAPLDKRGEIIGYMSLVNPIGVALGPALGGFLQAEVGNEVLFLISAELAFVALFGMLPIVNPPVTKLPKTNRENPQFWRILVSPRVRIPSIIMLLVGLVFGALHTFVPLYIRETGIELNPGLFYTAAAASSFSMRLFTGRASDRLGRGLFITLSLVFYTVAMVLLWMARDTALFLLAGIVEGAASGTLIPMITTLMADRAQPHERGKIFATCLMGLDIGIAIAGLVIGFAAQELGYRTLFGLSALLTLLGIFIFMTQSNKDLQSSLRFSLGRGLDDYALK
jgi:MFS family permease